MSELFKHRDLDATLVMHATERKHDDRYHFYWYLTIPTLVAILLAIMICNSYPYLFRNLFQKIRCTTQPVVNSTTGEKPQRPPDVQPNSNLLPVSYSPMEVGRKLSSLPTLYKQWFETEIPIRQYNYDRR